MECQYCKKILKNKYTLNSHYKSKYCLQSQGKEKIKNKKFQCECCNNSFGRKEHLHKHLKICSANTPYAIKLRNELVECKALVTSLTQKVEMLEKEKDSWIKYSETLAKQPRTTTNNNNITQNNLLNLSIFKTPEDIKKIVDDKYDKNYLMVGQKGVAQFIHSHVLKPNEGDQPYYLVMDKSRGNVKYKLSRNEVVIDNGMKGLTEKMYPSIKSKAHAISLIENAMENPDVFECFQEIFSMIDDNTDFRNEMVKLNTGEPESIIIQ